MNNDEIERVGGVLCNLDLPHVGGSNGTRLNPDMPNWHHYVSSARVALDEHKRALAEAGYVIVPREPTEAMVDAADPICTVDAGQQGVDPAECWRAMIAVAPMEKPEGSDR